MKLNFKKLLLFIFILLAVIAAVGFFIKKPSIISSGDDQSKSDSGSKNTSGVQIVSTKPNPLNNNIIPASESIEITFSESLVNSPETRLRIDPEIKFKIELSSNRKTAKIIPERPFPLGTNFTLFISPETKFDKGKMDNEIIFRFSTVKFKGL